MSTEKTMTYVDYVLLAIAAAKSRNPVSRVVIKAKFLELFPDVATSPVFARSLKAGINKANERGYTEKYEASFKLTEAGKAAIAKLKAKKLVPTSTKTAPKVKQSKAAPKAAAKPKAQKINAAE